MAEPVARATVGGVVLGPDKRVVVVSQFGSSWSLPKGGIDPGETQQQALRREISEEAGLTEISIIKKLGDYQRKRISKDVSGEIPGTLKHIHIYLCTTRQTELTPQDPENPEAIWLAIDEVAAKLTNPKDAAFYQSCLPEVENFLRAQA